MNVFPAENDWRNKSFLYSPPTPAFSLSELPNTSLSFLFCLASLRCLKDLIHTLKDADMFVSDPLLVSISNRGRLLCLCLKRRDCHRCHKKTSLRSAPFWNIWQKIDSFFPFQDRKKHVCWAPIDVIWLTSMWALAIISVLCLHRSLPHWQLFRSSLKGVLSRWITDLDAWHFPATELSRAGDQSPNESLEEVSWRYELFKWDTNRRGLCYCRVPYDNVLIWI